MRTESVSFKEFNHLEDWENYIRRHMSHTIVNDVDDEIRIVTARGETIAIWVKRGYGFVEECRSPYRLGTK